MTGLGELLFFSALAYMLYQFTPRKRVVEYCIKKSDIEKDALEQDYVISERTALKCTMEKLNLNPIEKEIEEEVKYSESFREKIEQRVIEDTFPEEKETKTK